MKPSRLKAYLALLTTAALWGIAGPVIKATLAYLPPFTFLFYRFAMVFLLSFPLYLLYLKKHPLKLADLLPLSLLGLMSTTINLSLIFLGFEKTTALDGTLLTSITPIFIVVLGVIFLQEQITRRELAGLILVFSGSIITVIQPLIEGKVFALQNLTGNLLILFAGLEWAFFVLFSKKNFAHYPPLLVILHASIIAFLSFFPLALLEQNLKFPNYQLLISNHQAFLGVAYMALLSYLFAFFLYEYGMSKIEISEGSVFSYLQPLFAAPIAIIFLQETLTFPFLFGAGLIALGLVLSEWK